MKPPFSNFSGVVRTENILSVFNSSVDEKNLMRFQSDSPEAKTPKLGFRTMIGSEKV